MTTLTKTEFWNPLYIKYPGELQMFYDWIDEYKKKVGWNGLFSNCGHPTTDIKYHHLPIAMQWGIFQQFCAEQHPSGFGGISSEFEHPADFNKIPSLIEEYFAEMKSNNNTKRMNAKYNDDFFDEI